jgi:hypothetical protein
MRNFIIESLTTIQKKSNKIFKKSFYETTQIFSRVAPTNEAFNGLPKGTVETLLNQRIRLNSAKFSLTMLRPATGIARLLRQKLKRVTGQPD